MGEGPKSEPSGRLATGSSWSCARNFTDVAPQTHRRIWLIARLTKSFNVAAPPEYPVSGIHPDMNPGVGPHGRIFRYHIPFSGGYEFEVKSLTLAMPLFSCRAQIVPASSSHTTKARAELAEAVDSRGFPAVENLRTPCSWSRRTYTKPNQEGSWTCAHC